MVYHVIINGQKRIVTSEQLKELNESKEEIRIDEQWYDSNGYVSWDDFKKDHPL